MLTEPMDIVFIGAGRLATCLACALHGHGHRITTVYSRTAQSAQVLAQRVGAQATASIADLPVQADAFIIAVKDEAIGQLLPLLAQGREQCCFFHTAGSVPMTVFESAAMQHYGVLYPMQTFSKERLVDFSRVPFFLEASDAQTMACAHAIAGAVSNNVSELPSDKRRQLHLAAVFACNFVNHCYDLSAQLLEENGLSFSVMHPLIEETLHKAMTMHPHDAQTGPAIRFDRQVIDMQRHMLDDRPQMRQVYEVMSSSIHERFQSDSNTHTRHDQL